MCMLNTAFGIVLLGTWSMIKNVVLLKASLNPELVKVQWITQFLNSLYQTASTVMAFTLVTAVLLGDKLRLLRYGKAARLKARAWMWWQVVQYGIDGATCAKTEWSLQGAGENNTTEIRTCEFNVGAATIPLEGLIGFLYRQAVYLLRGAPWKSDLQGSNTPRNKFMNISLLGVQLQTTRVIDVAANYRFDLPDPDIAWSTAITPMDTEGFHGIIVCGIFVIIGIYIVYRIRMHIIGKIETYAATLPD